MYAFVCIFFYHFLILGMVYLYVLNKLETVIGSFGLCEGGLGSEKRMDAKWY